MVAKTETAGDAWGHYLNQQRWWVPTPSEAWNALRATLSFDTEMVVEARAPVASLDPEVAAGTLGKLWKLTRLNAFNLVGVPNLFDRATWLYRQPLVVALRERARPAEPSPETLEWLHGWLENYVKVASYDDVEARAAVRALDPDWQENYVKVASYDDVEARAAIRALDHDMVAAALDLAEAAASLFPPVRLGRDLLTLLVADGADFDDALHAASTLDVAAA